MNTLYIWTKDGLRLQAVHYEPENNSSETCVLITPGMSGNIIENYFCDVLGKTLALNNIGCIYGHNRGYNHINDIIQTNGQTVRIGATYERFKDCVIDINAWVKNVQKLGYKKIVLLGHSLGCNKAIHFLNKSSNKNIVGLVLASPPDMVGLFEKPEYQPNHKQLLAEAKRNVEQGKPQKLVSGKIWDWYNLSSQTYLDLSTQGGTADNLPVMRNPEVFPQLAKITIPILGIMGEKDDIAIRTLKEDLDLVQSKASSCPKFTKVFIKNGNHTYDNEEEQFANVVKDWVKSL